MSAEDALFRVIKPVVEAMFDRSPDAGAPGEVATIVEKVLTAFAEAVKLDDHRASLRDRLLESLRERARQPPTNATASAASKSRDSSRE